LSFMGSLLNYRTTVLAFAVLSAGFALAQVHRHDPLNPAESDQLREASMEPNRKLPLYVQFARARLATLEQLLSDPRLAEGRGQKIHDLLVDFKIIVDEMDRNIDSFADQKLDFRKALKEVIQADSEFQVKLRTVKEGSSGDPKAAAEAKQYEFAILDAIDAVNGDLDNARDLLNQQEKAAAEAKAKAKQKGTNR
jgi:hypothetical protein